MSSFNIGGGNFDYNNPISFFNSLSKTDQSGVESLDPSLAAGVKNGTVSPEKLDSDLMAYFGKNTKLSPQAQAAEQRFQQTKKTTPDDLDLVLSSHFAR